MSGESEFIVTHARTASHAADIQAMIFTNRFSPGAVMPRYSKHDRIFRKLVPSVAKLSYNPVVKIAGNAIAWILALPFPDLRDLPPNHLRIRIGTGNRIFNGHVNFIRDGNELWLMFLSRKYCTSNSDVVELGCGCGRLTRPLRDPPWNPLVRGYLCGCRY